MLNLSNLFQTFHITTLMQKILFIVRVTLPKRFTGREFNLTIRECSITSQPDHHLQRLVEKGYLKHKGKGIYELA